MTVVAKEGSGVSPKHDGDRMTSSWVLYAFLLFARVVVSPLLPGYIHPDEFFQGGQELWFGCPPSVPWEFQTENALRSVVPPALMTWAPLLVYSWLSRKDIGCLSGREILLVPRVACALFSVLTVDWSLWRVCNKNGKTKNSVGVPIPVLLLASAWPTFAMLARPFSNALETFVFAVLFSTVVCNSQNPTGLSSSKKTAVFAFQVGALAALGIFTRFTFAFFAFPVLLFLLYDMINILGLGRQLIRIIFLMTISFLLLAFGIVVADSLFYSSRLPFNDGSQTQIAQHWFPSSQIWPHYWVLTPYNAFAYNSKVSNLADHGLHPRWTHAAVNMFILYGPLTLVGYLSVLSNSSVGRFPSQSLSIDSQQDGMATSVAVSQAVVILGLAFLSVAPHQEPRFLLPLICPLVLMGSRLVQIKIGKFVWILFNLILLTFFGALHQAGVISSLLAIGSSRVLVEHSPVAWIYFRTYMPPTFLTRLSYKFQEPMERSRLATEVDSEDVGDACRKWFRLVDLNGASMQSLLDTLEVELDCSNTASWGSSRYVSVVVPPLTEKDDDGSTYSFRSSGLCELPGRVYTCKIVWSSRPHLTTEDFPSFQLPMSELNELPSISTISLVPDFWVPWYQ